MFINKTLFIEKIKASLFHLLLSLIIVTLSIAGILYFFFPRMFINVTDFKEVASIIILVDLILGPLLTFVVFKPKKNTLKLDLSVVAAIQVTALLYGVYALYQIHPVYITFNVDRFTIVNARDAEPETATHKEFKVSKLATAKLAYAKMPDDIEKKNEVSLIAGLGGGDLDQREEYYEPYEDHLDKIISRGIDHNIMLEAAGSDKEISNFLDNNDLKNLVFIPINSTKKDAIIVLDKMTAQPLATINSDPWVLTKK